MYVSECVRAKLQIKGQQHCDFFQKLQVNAMWGSHSPYAVLPQWRLELLDATEKIVDSGLCVYV